MAVESDHGDSLVASAGWLREFLRLEAAGGLLLMAAAALAMLVANSPLQSFYQGLLALPFEIRLGTFEIAKPLLLWVNDGLMAIFFLLIGLELKREVLDGTPFEHPECGPAGIRRGRGHDGAGPDLRLFNWGDPVAMRGWAIPTATDIAFTLGILTLLGRGVPPGLKAFLLGIAIFDDLAAIVIIAVFYTAELSLVGLAVAVVALMGLAILNRLGVERLTGYVVLGLILWVAVLKSGVHATLAGAALAAFIPFAIGDKARSKRRPDLP